MPGGSPGSKPGGEDFKPAARDEIEENVVQALKAAEARTAAAAAKAAGAAAQTPGGSSAGGSGAVAGGRDAGASMTDAGVVEGEWLRSRNRINSQRHRDAGVRAPKRYRKQVDDYFRRMAREAEEAAKKNSNPAGEEQ